jgi:hypothetical protein
MISSFEAILAQDKVSTLLRATIKKEQNSPCETSYYSHQHMIQKHKEEVQRISWAFGAPCQYST